MPVKNQNLIKSNDNVSWTSNWELNSDLENVKNLNSLIRNSRKVNLGRGKILSSEKACALASRSDIRAKSRKGSEGKKLEKKNLRNSKEVENCRSARSHSANSIKESQKGKCSDTLRTRSMSPTPSTPPLEEQLPLRKFSYYSSKIKAQFETVKALITRESEAAESLNELNRQRKRATEFAVRFSRNKLYQMRRILNEIKETIVPYPFVNLAKRDSEVLCKKILLAYQTGTQSLQTYTSYLKSGQSLDVPDKARELVLLIADLYLCCKHLSIPGDQIDLLSSCKDLVILLDAKIAEASGKASFNKSNERFRRAEKKDKRFSMYKTKLTNSGWKKKTEALAKVKFGVPKLSYLKKSKKLEASMSLPKSTFEIYAQGTQNTRGKEKGFKTEPDENSKEAKATALVSPKKLHATPREVSSQDDDDIETVVQTIDDEEMLNKFSDTYSEFDDRFGYMNKANVHKLIMETIEEMRSPERKDVKASLKKLLKTLDSQQPSSIQPKNVKFIRMISHETIPEEPEEESDTKEENSPAKDVKPKKIFQSVSNISKSENLKEIRVTSESKDEILKYKKVLLDYRKNHVMYKKGVKVEPCELVVRISDSIINDILTEISSAMENDSLLKQLYCNELLEMLNKFSDTYSEFDDRFGYMNKANVHKLIMETIEEMRSPERKDVKASLKKLLKTLDSQQPSSIQPKNVKFIRMI